MFWITSDIEEWFFLTFFKFGLFSKKKKKKLNKATQIFKWLEDLATNKERKLINGVKFMIHNISVNV